mgnify:CR=1 FL=1
MLTCADTLIVIVDIQEKLVRAMHAREELLVRAQQLIRGARVLNVPVLVTEQNPKGLGVTVPEIAAHLAGVRPISKFSFGCCAAEEFLHALQAGAARNVLMAGIETHVCVYQTARELAQELIAAFTSGEADQVFLVYNEFKSAIQQQVVAEKLLPIEQLDREGAGLPADYIYEPAEKDLFDRLLPKHVEVQVYRALLESAASEQGARMTAMDSATNNAADMIESLTLNMNKVRQAGITKEILEVVSGAVAPD